MIHYKILKHTITEISIQEFARKKGFNSRVLLILFRILTRHFLDFKQNVDSSEVFILQKNRSQTPLQGLFDLPKYLWQKRWHLLVIFFGWVDVIHFQVSAYYLPPYFWQHWSLPFGSIHRQTLHWTALQIGKKYLWKGVQLGKSVLCHFLVLFATSFKLLITISCRQLSFSGIATQRRSKPVCFGWRAISPWQGVYWKLTKGMQWFFQH